MVDKKKRYRLRDLDIDRVDLVKRGANQFADIVIAKEDTSSRDQLITSLEKHYGPGPHKNGTPQSVHGEGGGGGSSTPSSPSSEHPKYGNVDTRPGVKSLWSEGAIARSQLEATVKRIKALDKAVYTSMGNYREDRPLEEIKSLRDKLYTEKSKLRSGILRAGKKVFPNTQLDTAEKTLSSDDLDLFKFVFQNATGRFGGNTSGYDITALSDSEISNYIERLYKRAGILKADDNDEDDQLKNGLAPLLRNKKKKRKKKGAKGRKASGSAFPDKVAADSSDAP